MIFVGLNFSFTVQVDSGTHEGGASYNTEDLTSGNLQVIYEILQAAWNHAVRR